MEANSKGEAKTQDVKEDPPVRPEPEVPSPTNPPHPVSDEDPEEHMGEVIEDPWVDPSQEDWPNSDEDTEEVTANG